MNGIVQALLLAICLLAGQDTMVLAVDRSAGWWVIVGSFPTGPWQRQQADFDTIQTAAASCSLDVFNDFSAKFEGFRPGYNVFVIGAFGDEATARENLRRARPCFPDAYVKYGEHLGE